MMVATLLVALAGLATVGNVFGTVPPLTVHALRDLWEQTGGPYWSDGCSIGLTWDNTTDPCASYSLWILNDLIECDASGNTVVSLELQSCNLTGTLPESIGDLAGLQTLVLTLNSELGGSIPASIGELVSLTQLYLYSNQLSGSIPDAIGNLVDLTVLALFSNHLSGSIPDTIGNLVTLKQLDLQSNNLSGSIPDTIGNLVKM
jgi:hypothetical protein